jgi:serine/threonine-protein kinase
MLLDATLAHPHLVQVYACGEFASADGSRLRYVVTEPVTGSGLRARLAAGPLPWPAAVRAGAEIAGALAAVHGRGLMFGDLQPADVVLTSAGAKMIRLGVLSVSPERSPASDVYALGRLLHLMIAGGPAVPGTGSARSLLAVDGLPVTVVDLCTRCLTRIRR